MMGKKLTLFGILLKQERTVSNIIPFANIYLLRIALTESVRDLYQALASMMYAIKMNAPRIL
jgi:hypothetical protein